MSADQTSGPARPIRPGSKTQGSVRLPPSKSVTNRALNLALLVDGATEVVSPLESEDIEAMVAAHRKLGCSVGIFSGGLRSVAQDSVAAADIDCGASGTLLRFLTASLSTRPGTWTLDGTERLRQRPLGPLIDALRDLGATIECLAAEGFAPIRIRGGSLEGGDCTLDGSASSQYLSALLMASVRAKRRVSVRVSGLTSVPYVELTLRTMADFGFEVERASETFKIDPQQVAGRRFAVEADFSSACYFGAAAALTGGRVTLRGLRRNSAQGDARFFEILERMGASCSWRDDDLEVAGSDNLLAVVDDLSDLPDQVPTLAVLAPFAEGTTEISNVGHLRLKESDRLRVVANGLERAGATGVIEGAASISVPGVWARADPPPDPVTVGTADDHRIAMSFALLGLRRPGLSIDEAQVVAKSYPGFWDDFSSVCEA